MEINNNEEVQKWVISPDPISLDWIDLHIDILPLSFEEVSRTERAESSAAIRERVI